MNKKKNNPHLLALVVPVYNEVDLIAAALPKIIASVQEAAPTSRVELIAVDDGSTDGTRQALAQLAGHHTAVRFISFTRNFGKEAAIHAGLRAAMEMTAAEVVVVIDADLQHPPTLVGDMLGHWRQGYMVAEAVKRERATEGPLRRWAARSFYSVFTRLSGLSLDEDTDFKLLDREVVTAVLQFGERARFFRGIVRWLGYPAARVPFDVAPRAAGNSGWGLIELAQDAWQNLTSFSSAPLGLVTLFGGIGLSAGAMLAGKALFDRFQGTALSGFSTVILLQILFSSLILLSLGIIGSYVARIYDELKSRPHYILRSDDVLLQSARNDLV